jgi:hypothetical protein
MSQVKMDNSEFLTRALANPYDQEQDFLDALQQDPTRRQIVDEAQADDRRLSKSLNSVTVPEGLSNQLKAAIETETESDTAVSHASDSDTNVVELKRPWISNQGIALAATLVLALGVTYSVLFNTSGPSDAELAFSQQVMDHVYMELEEIALQSNGVDQQMVAQAFDAVGAQVRNANSLDSLNISFAKPCFIVPESRSAHLALVGNQGAVNIIVVKNSPVQAEFAIGDERFSGIVIPVEGGNLILGGEQQESLNNYREIFSENVDWVI